MRGGSPYGEAALQEPLYWSRCIVVVVVVLIIVIVLVVLAIVVVVVVVVVVVAPVQQPLMKRGSEAGQKPLFKP